METAIKLGIITIVILEVLSIITHLDILVAFVGESIMSLIPMFIMIAVIIYLIRMIFR